EGLRRAEDGLSNLSTVKRICALLGNQSQCLCQIMVLENFPQGRRLIVVQKHTTAFSVPKQILDRKSTRLNSSHVAISYAVFCSHRPPPASPLFPYTTLFRSRGSATCGGWLEQSLHGKKNLRLVGQSVAVPLPDHGSGKFPPRPEAYRCAETHDGFQRPEANLRRNLPSTRESIPGRGIPRRHRKLQSEKYPSRGDVQSVRAMCSSPQPRRAQ